MSLEIRKPIDGFWNYEVSTWGNVYNRKTGRRLNPEVHDKGYLRVNLTDADGVRHHMKVHRLVAEAFIPNIYGKPHINHIDGNNQNNSVSNLEWVTNCENAAKAKALRDAQFKLQVANGKGEK